MAVCFPVAVGFKYNVSDNVNVFAEVGYRFTTSDYLDDVSTTYARMMLFHLPMDSHHQLCCWPTEVLKLVTRLVLKAGSEATAVKMIVM